MLNVGYGLIETVGGFLSDSQALKADALDFVGDGLISFLGLLALGWRPVWRARSASVCLPRPPTAWSWGASQKPT